MVPQVPWAGLFRNITGIKGVLSEIINQCKQAW